MIMLYPIGIQTFSEIRNGGYVYVDKTAAVFNLAATGKYYFLSRPRRFGKSLLVSTMEAYFSGKKELFKGLAMESLEQDWTEYPVLHFDFSGKSYATPDALSDILNIQLKQMENVYGVEVMSDACDSRLKGVIEAACRKTGRKVVVLIDEYDKPVIDNLTRPELRKPFRETLEGFYSVLKGKDEFIRFGFLTGVTKIGKMSVFSWLNNIQDISMRAEYSGICGISETELKSYFGESTTALAQADGISVSECYEKLAKMYDGYHFYPKAAGVYNPFSLINTFNANEFGEYWFETGTPSFLVKYLKDGKYNLENISRNRVPLIALSGTNYAEPQPISLMYQSGYLTITGYDPEFRTYTLDYPNEEVRSGFLNSLSQLYAPGLIEDEFSVYQFVSDIRGGDVESFMTRFTSFLAGNSYEIHGELELYFQNTMYVMFKMMGLYVKTEYRTSNGRIDITLETDKYVYIIELKRDQSPEVALAQIEEKGYDKPFLASGKQIIKLGINFSSETRTIDGWSRGNVENKKIKAASESVLSVTIPPVKRGADNRAKIQKISEMQ